MIASTFVLNNSVQELGFPLIVTTPTGLPGNPNVYAQPNPPQSFSG